MKDELRDLVYSALLGETTWQSFLARLAATMPDGKAALVVHDTSSNDGYALIEGAGEKTAREYNTYYARLNPLQLPLSLRKFGVGACDHELMPREELVGTEFHDDFLAPHGMSYSAGVRLAQVGSQSFTLVTACGTSTPHAIRESIGTLNHLAPHLSRAIGYYRDESSRRTANVLGAMSLEAVSPGLIIINDQRRIRFASKAARAMLAGSSPVRVSPNGRVCFRKADTQSACERMLKRGYAGPHTIDFLSHHTKLTLVNMEGSAVSTYFEGPSVAALMTQLDTNPTHYDLQLFSDAYTLSKGEARALSGLVAGLSTGQIAEEASLSRETIRSQVKSLYAKTGVASMADVLRLVYRSCRV